VRGTVEKYKREKIWYSMVSSMGMSISVRRDLVLVGTWSLLSSLEPGLCWNLVFVGTWSLLRTGVR
jgi:hypothetical protein